MQTIRRIAVLGGVTVLAAAALAVPAAADTQVTELASLVDGGGRDAKAVNDQGQAAGTSLAPDKSVHAVRWDADGTITDLGDSFDGKWSIAYGINNGGVVVGEVDGDGHRNPTRWDADGTPTRLDLPDGAVGGEARAINNDGVIVGWTKIGDVDHGVR
ncbi:hypothetical protein [Kutzneria buriramensis]|uniref:Putative HAF family extracellular repeat protein n=1 Tax=Kutzneria buriramensis TaxID=1045776 RepID=A0A3E0HMF2_9PSEU|nr:hypothetical protein [Kutzneria buriramensis]REH47205.1 putative HAF family extracellular repeat protein [Kutzneria buriramensis]